jgi:hypothetical protein
LKILRGIFLKNGFGLGRVRFGAAFEQARKTSTHWQGLFLSGWNLLFPPEALHYLQCHFSPLAGGSFVRASSNAALNYP